MTNIFLCCGWFAAALGGYHIKNEKIKKWLDRNKWSLNWSKTKIMLFGNCKSNTQAVINIIDHKTCCKPHMNKVQTKLWRSISVLGKAKHVLDHKSLRILYCSLELPYLDYCVEVWGNSYKNSLQPLFAQKSLQNSSYQDHTNTRFWNSQALKLKDLVEFQTAQIMYEAKNNLRPGNIERREGDDY